MPIYVYKCGQCGLEREELEPISTPSDASHPCPGKRALSGFGVPPRPEDVYPCEGVMRRIPALPSPAQFNCSMPTYQKGKG